MSSHTGRRKILIGAYACEPHKGSEPAVGLAWAVAASQHNDVSVITRTNNLDSLAPFQSADLRFIGVDLPHAFVRLKPILGVQWYYLLWQLLAGMTAFRLSMLNRYDAVHHLTFASDWMPPGVLVARSPVRVWGPIGGRAPWPWQPVKWLGIRGTIGELRRQATTSLMRMTLGRLATKRATTILAQNATAAELLPFPKTVVHPNVVVDIGVSGTALPPQSSLTAIVVGRLEPLKAVRLALASTSELKRQGQSWNLIVVGDGADRAALKKYCRRLQIDDRVKFVGRMSREETLREIASATVLVSTCMREAGGFAVAEAVSIGVPVVYVDVCGPAVLVPAGRGVGVPPGPDLEIRLAEAMSVASSIPRLPDLAWGQERLVELLDCVYRGESLMRWDVRRAND